VDIFKEEQVSKANRPRGRSEFKSGAAGGEAAQFELSLSDALNRAQKILVF
jgi:hypothetical protein